MYLNVSECLVHGQRDIDATVLLFAFTRRWYRRVPANHSARLATSHSETWIIWLNFQNVLQIQRIGSSLTYSFKRCFLKLRPRWSATKTIWLKKIPKPEKVDVNFKGRSLLWRNTLRANADTSPQRCTETKRHEQISQTGCQARRSHPRACICLPLHFLQEPCNSCLWTAIVFKT